MKKFSFKIRGHKYDVEVKNHEKNIIDIEINGSQYSVELEHEIQTKKTPTLMRPVVQTHKKINHKESTGVYKVACPLPGNIMNIMVKVGDKVSVGNKLLVYEAMKMENALESEKSGTISKILVNVGDAVLQDDIVIEISL